MLKYIFSIILIVLLAPVGVSAQAGALNKIPEQTGKSGLDTSLFRYIETFQITPDTNYPDYLNGTLGYIHYIPQTDRFIVVFSTYLKDPGVPFDKKATVVKEYYTHMQATGRSWILNYAYADETTQVIGDYLYAASMANGPGDPETGQGPWTGWLLEKFDIFNYTRVDSAIIVLCEADSTSFKADDGPTISMVNGLIDVTGEYFVDGNPDHPLGRGSHHHFFATDTLVSQGEMILKPPEYPGHCPMVSINQPAGEDIYMFASTSYEGNLLMLRFDNEWNFIEQDTFQLQGRFPTGLVIEDNRFYVAYIDYSHVVSGDELDIRLAGFDSEWNVLGDIAVTTPAADKRSDSPWVILNLNLLYVSYVTYLGDTLGQSYVSIYELNRNYTPVESNEGISSGVILEQNYPNPFSSLTYMTFTLPSSQPASLKIYDMQGREVGVMVDEIMPPGTHTVTLNAKGLMNGVYFYKLTTGDHTQTRKCVVLR